MKKQAFKNRLQNPITKQFETAFVVAEIIYDKCIGTHIELESGYKLVEGMNKDDIRYLYKSIDELKELGFN